MVSTKPKKAGGKPAKTKAKGAPPKKPTPAKKAAKADGGPKRWRVPLVMLLHRVGRSGDPAMELGYAGFMHVHEKTAPRARELAQRILDDHRASGELDAFLHGGTRIDVLTPLQAKAGAVMVLASHVETGTPDAAAPAATDSGPLPLAGELTTPIDPTPEPASSLPTTPRFSQDVEA